jgi:hypothetical protein
MARTNIQRGIDGRISINGTFVSLERWRISTTADDIPAIGFEDVSDAGAFDDGDTGLVTTVLSCSGYFDVINNPHNSPPGIVPGAILANVRFYLSKANNKFYLFPEIRVLQVEVNDELRQRVDISFTAKANGAWSTEGTF